MVQGVLYCGDDKKLGSAAELCIICQWEWKIRGAGTSIKVAISTWQYWTVWISHPLRGISEGQTNAGWFFFFFILCPSVFCPHCHCVPQSNYQLMNGGLFLHRSCRSPVEAETWGSTEKQTEQIRAAPCFYSRSDCAFFPPVLLFKIFIRFTGC